MVIAEELAKMARARLLNTCAYAQEVAKKKIRTKARKKDLSPKSKYRRTKRKLCQVIKQNTSLRLKVCACYYILYISCHHVVVCMVTQLKLLRKENADMAATIQSLQRGDHDIELRDGSQDDMVNLFAQCNADTSLDAKIASDDETGTLALFWKEQKARMAGPTATKVQRKPWNPIVLRCLCPCDCGVRM